MQARQSSRPPRAQRSRGGGDPLWRSHPWLTLVLVIVIAIFAVGVAPAPWALHIGGRFSPTESWSGYGPVRASNGGRYVLFTQFQGGLFGGKGTIRPCAFQSCGTLKGTARLCTRAGKTYSFRLAGSLHAWLTTDGARTSIDLTGGSLPPGWVVAFHGSWRGPVLPLAGTGNSFTEVFAPSGQIRQVRSAAAAGSAHAVLRYGPASGFDGACRLLDAGPR